MLISSLPDTSESSSRPVTGLTAQAPMPSDRVTSNPNLAGDKEILQGRPLMVAGYNDMRAATGVPSAHNSSGNFPG
jgi:hypothetical protein